MRHVLEESIRVENFERCCQNSEIAASTRLQVLKLCELDSPHCMDKLIFCVCVFFLFFFVESDARRVDEPKPPFMFHSL
jgi:hypothetical protein